MKLITRELCLAKDLGVHGNLFGGAMMSWLDKAAAIEATRLCQSNKMVTAEIETIKFVRKVKENQQVWIYGEVESIGNTSIVLKMEARKYNVYTKEEKLVCQTKVIFVRIDDEGNKRPLGVGAKLEIEEEIKQRLEHEQSEN
jgi:acyl-CoA thioesterase YciA